MPHVISLRDSWLQEGVEAEKKAGVDWMNSGMMDLLMAIKQDNWRSFLWHLCPSNGGCLGGAASDDPGS